jgi:hypothetical protein
MMFRKTLATCAALLVLLAIGAASASASARTRAACSHGNGYTVWAIHTSCRTTRPVVNYWMHHEDFPHVIRIAGTRWQFSRRFSGAWFVNGRRVVFIETPSFA